MTDVCADYCELPASRMFVAAKSDPSSPGGFAVFSFDPSSCATVIRTGDNLYGCPGDTSPPPDPSLSGSVGVYGQVPVSVRFSDPTAVGLGTAPGEPVLYSAANSTAELSASSVLFSGYHASFALGTTVLPGLTAVAVAGVFVALAVRFVRRARSAV